MNEIVIRNHTLNSREVAGMVGKQHTHLLRDIETYIKYMEESGQSRFGSADFFVESTYPDEQKKPRKCYLITKSGCEMIAHKMTGQKGTLFTAAYISRFREMEQALQSSVPTVTKPNTPRAKPVDMIFRQRLNMARDFSRVTSIPLGIAVAKAIDDAERLTGEDYDHWKRALPARTDEAPIPHLNATQLGATIGLSAKEMNMRLEAAGLQSKIDKCWRLTEAGKLHAEEYPFERNGHSDYYIRWHESAAEAVKRMAGQLPSEYEEACQ